MYALANASVVADDKVLSGHSVLLQNDRIAAICPDDQLPAGTRTVDLKGGLLLPGFIDIQVNGGGGVLFNDLPTVEGLRAIAAAHIRFGTTGFLPTLISADYPDIRKAIAAVDAAIDAGVPGILGIHIEGPFISPARKGIHDAAHFRDLDEEGLEIVSSLRRGKTVLTLAPERVPADTIRRLTDAHVIVSAGHSDCDYATGRDALNNGVRGVTHLYNAMSQHGSRAPGLVGAALDNRSAWCGIVADGHHVHPASLRIALACRGTDHMMIVTDAMPGVGSEKTSFLLQGKTITIKDGICKGPDGTLGGSNLDMATGFGNARRFFDADEPLAARLTSGNAAEFLGISDETGRIAPGLRADLVHLDATGSVTQTWIAGTPQLN